MALGAALAVAFAVGWEILWALVRGFALSGAVRAVVTKGEYGPPADLGRARRLGATAVLGHIVLRRSSGLGKRVLDPLIGDPLIRPLVAVLSFVCSVGNVHVAAVLWNGGISFGGVIAFLFADLIILPIVNIYRKYYGIKIAGLLFVLFYIAMAAAGWIVDRLFALAGLIPRKHDARVLEATVQLNYTTFLNVIFLAVSAFLIWRFLRTGGSTMLRMMTDDKAMKHDQQDHAQHPHHQLTLNADGFAESRREPLTLSRCTIFF